MEKTLFHGTSLDAVESINKYGFNRSFGSVQAYGNGVYFARDSTLSAEMLYAKPDRNGHQMVYIAKVLTGHSALGVVGMKFPPQRAPGILFDSMVNNTDDPTIYVSGHNDNQIYAEYLVEFKQRDILGRIRVKNNDSVPVTVWYMGPTSPRNMGILQPNGHLSITCHGKYGQVFSVCQCKYAAPPADAAKFVFQSKHGIFLDVAFVDNVCVILN